MIANVANIELVLEEECFDGRAVGREVVNHAPVGDDWSLTAKITIAEGGGYIVAKGATNGNLFYALQVHPTQERIYFHYKQLQSNGKQVVQRKGFNTPGLKDGQPHLIVLAVSTTKEVSAIQVDNNRQLELFTGNMVECTVPSDECMLYVF